MKWFGNFSKKISKTNLFLLIGCLVILFSLLIVWNRILTNHQAFAQAPPFQVYGVSATYKIFNDSSFLEKVKKDRGNNLFLNPSFDNGLDNWDIEATDLSKITLDNGTIKMSSKTTNEVLYIAQMVSIEPNTTYKISLRAKKENIQRDPSDNVSWHAAYIFGRWHDADQQEITEGFYPDINAGLGTADWETYSTSVVTSPPNARFLRIRAALELASGTVWYDDFQLTKDYLLPHDPEIFLEYKNHLSENVQISAARNEYEPFQIVVSSDRDLQNIAVESTDLKDIEGNVIPKSQISTHLVEYVDLTADYPKFEPRLHGLIGVWPDPLWPFDPEADTFNVQANQSQPLWFTVYVPENTMPGEYTGEIKIKPENSSEKTIPITLIVWGFSLPKETHLKTPFNLGGNIPEHHGTTENTEQLVERYYDNYMKHRLSPFLYVRPFEQLGKSIKVKAINNNSEVEIDFLDFDEIAEEYLDNFTAFTIPYADQGKTFLGFDRSKPEEKETFELLMRDYLKKLASHLNEKGWLNKAFIYIWDEPWSQEEYDSIRYLSSVYKSANTGIKIATTREPIPELFGAIDIWVVPLWYSKSSYDQEIANERRKLGEAIWLYGSEILHINCPAIASKIPLWMAWKYNVSGYLYYWTNGWQTNLNPDANPSNSWFYGNPWVNGQIIEGGRNFGPGNGFLFYPPCKDGPCNYPEPNRIAPSIRWELLREGMEDYEYFRLLQDLIDEAKQSGVSQDKITLAEQTLTEVSSLTSLSSSVSFETNPENYHQIRLNVAQVIENLESEVPIHCQPLGDIDCSGKVNALDLSVLLAAFGKTGTSLKEDLDNSGKVNALDLSILLSNFGKSG